MEAGMRLEKCRNHYDHERPRSALGYRTSLKFAALCEPVRAERDLTKELEALTAPSWKPAQ